MVNTLIGDNATLLSEYNANYIADCNNSDDSEWTYSVEPAGNYWRVKVTDEEGVDLGYL